MPDICRIITDHKIGNINPAFALAEAIKEHIPLEIEHIIVKKKLIFKFIPVWMIRYKFIQRIVQKSYMLTDNNNVMLTIGNGSASVLPTALLSISAKQKGYEGLFVQLQNPRINNNYYDYIIAPMHDNVSGHNVIPTLGALSRVKHFINKPECTMPQEFEQLTRPIVGVFIGGKNSKFKFSEPQVTLLAQYLIDYIVYNKTSLIVTFSRRTGRKNEILLKSLLKHENIVFADMMTDNPYYKMLKYCDTVIVTCDSVNMISDAVTAGKHIIIYELPGNKGKFQQFYDSLHSKNLLSMSIDRKESNEQFDEAQRVARIISTALSKRWNAR